MKVLEALQLLGAAAVLAGLTWILGPLVLLVAGGALLVIPELVTARARRNTKAQRRPT